MDTLVLRTLFIGPRLFLSCRFQNYTTYYDVIHTHGVKRGTVTKLRTDKQTHGFEQTSFIKPDLHLVLKKIKVPYIFHRICK